MTIRLASTAYALPAKVETTVSILARERVRVQEALRTVAPDLRARAISGLGIEEVRICETQPPFELMFSAATAALEQAGVRQDSLDLIIEFSTLADPDEGVAPLAHKLAASLDAQASLNLSLRFAGCAGFHLALKQAVALMRTDPALRSALLVAADSPPPGSRSLMPITVQGDAGSAVVLRKDVAQGPEILGTEVRTLGHLHGTITSGQSPDASGMQLRVDVTQLQDAVMPVYYLNFHRLIHKVLADHCLTLSDIDHVVYANVSRTDQEGFVRTLKVPAEKMRTPMMRCCGHTFGSDVVLNYTELQRTKLIRPNQWLLLASAGAGFAWGVTLVRT